MDAVGEFCERLTLAFATLVRDAAPESRIAMARTLLGARFVDVACESMRRHVRRVLLDEREQTLGLLGVRTMGNLPLQALAGDVLAAVLEDVDRAADPLRGAVVAGGVA